MPIFTVETQLLTTEEEWKVVHKPNHAELKQDIEVLLKNVIKATSVVPRIEGVFRKDRQEVLDNIYAMIEEHDRSGNSKPPDKVAPIQQKVYANNYSNLTKQE